MDPANQGGNALQPRHVLGGLQAGVAGALAMLACLAVGSLWDQRSVWVAPNLFATTFYGPGVYYNEYAGTAWAGVALLIVLYGSLGALWGCLWRDKQKRMLRVLGALFGLVVYRILFDIVWPHVNGLVVLYAPNTQLEIGHVLWGILLARSPRYSRLIAERLQDLPPTIPVPTVAAPAVATVYAEPAIAGAVSAAAVQEPASEEPAANGVAEPAASGVAEPAVSSLAEPAVSGLAEPATGHSDEPAAENGAS